MIHTFENVTRASFNAQAYRLGNKDILDTGVDPTEHYLLCGHKESRRQLNPELLSTGAYRKRKFDRFKDLLISPESIASFPVSIGGVHFNLDDYQSESANSGFGPFIADIQANPDANFLDLGCGLRDRLYDNCLYLEVYPSVSADVIAGTDCTYPIKSDSMDGIGCFAVLEHTRKPWQVVQEIHRMLKKGGRVYIDWPFLQPIHGFPSHFFNATREGLVSIFQDAGFDIAGSETFPFQGPDHTISWILGKFIRSLPPDKRKRVSRMRVSDLIDKPPESEFWRDILSGLPDNVISEFACGNCLFARKT